MYNNASDRIPNILNYYKENNNCDPNVNEYIILCNDFADYLIHETPNYGIYGREEMVNGQKVYISEEARKQYPIVAVVHDKFIILTEEFNKKLLKSELGITEDSPLYLLCQESCRTAITYSKKSDVNLRAKVGGVALYIAQEKRNVDKGYKESFTYDNIEELRNINEMYKQSLNKTPLDLLVDDININFNNTYTSENNSNKTR